MQTNVFVTLVGIKLFEKNPQSLHALKNLFPLPGGSSPEIWVGVFGAILETLTLFQTQICDFLYPIPDLTQKFVTLFQTCPGTPSVCLHKKGFKFPMLIKSMITIKKSSFI